MLTDDGKHLYISWDEYHMLIEHRIGLQAPPYRKQLKKPALNHN